MEYLEEVGQQTCLAIVPFIDWVDVRIPEDNARLENGSVEALIKDLPDGEVSSIHIVGSNMTINNGIIQRQITRRG